VETHSGGGDECVPLGTCSFGYSLDAHGDCRADVVCPPGQHDIGGICVANADCPAGEHDGGDGVCVPEGRCVEGFELDEERCVPVPAATWRCVRVDLGGLGETPVPADFDGDGATDLAVYRRADGTWWIRSFLSSFPPVLGFQFGWHEAAPVPADFDGDGSADLAVYHDTTGNWFVTSLQHGTIAYEVRHGFEGTVALPGDFDGDGAADLAVYFAPAGNWYVRTVDGTVLAWELNFGWEAARGLVGRLGGSSATDLAVYYGDGRQWFVLLTEVGQDGRMAVNGGNYVVNAFSLGPEAGVPALGDVDGDGVDDLAVYQEWSASWRAARVDGLDLVVEDEPGCATEPGTGYDLVPFVADFDGNGTGDLTVHDPTSGRWYLKLRGL
jgi:hypothetical protein